MLGFESVADRDDAVELLRQLKPPGAAGGSGAAGSGAAGGGSKGASPGGSKLQLPSEAQRAALFRADPDLGTLYKSLVVAGILGEAEFWSTRQGLLRGGGAAGAGAAPRKQRVGLPSAMLADVKPSADGQTEKVHFQLTPEVIQQARLWAGPGAASSGRTQQRAMLSLGRALTGARRTRAFEIPSGMSGNRLGVCIMAFPCLQTVPTC